MRATATLVVSLMLLGCASDPAREPGSVSPPVSVRIPAGAAIGLEGDLKREGTIITGWIDAPVQDVWAHLADVYDEMGVAREQLTIINPGAHQIGIERHRLQRLNGRRLSDYLHCGQTMAGSTADRGDTRVSLMTWLEQDDARTAVRTTLQAMARESHSTRAVACSSRGTFEAELVSNLRDRLQRPGM